MDIIPKGSDFAASIWNFLDFMYCYEICCFRKVVEKMLRRCLRTTD